MEKSQTEKKGNFEQSFKRLDEIVERLNGGETTLDESLKLFEEADQLIISCSKKLNQAEKKVQLLIKNRAGEIESDEEGKPKMTDFNF